MTPPVPVFAGGVLVHLSELKTGFERTLEVNDAVPTRDNWVSDPLLERFLRYARIDTQSDEASADAPSTARQLVLAEMLKGELQALGLEADIGRGGIVYAHVPATAGAESAPAIGFIAHMDTSPDAPGANVKPQVLRYAGGDVVLNAEKGIVLSIERFPELKRYSGEPVVFTDGTTLLGADDKAGIAAIMGMLDHLREHPEIPHAKLSIAFTPDEEVGRGTENFDHARFGATYAYTFDGGELGELESENFNAASALVTIRGVGVHPGSAKGKMVNALRLAAKFIARLPMAMSPERTEAREGFIHPNNLEGTVVEAKLHLLGATMTAKLSRKRRLFCVRSSRSSTPNARRRKQRSKSATATRTCAPTSTARRRCSNWPARPSVVRASRPSRRRSAGARTALSFQPKGSLVRTSSRAASTITASTNACPSRRY